MIVLVTGGREFAERADREQSRREYDSLCDALWELHRQHGITCVVHGYARGADSVAREWADRRVSEDLGISVMGFRADWHGEGKAAGAIRNGRMVAWVKARVDAGETAMVLACPGGKGTTDCVKKARRAGLKVKRLDEVLKEYGP